MKVEISDFLAQTLFDRIESGQLQLIPLAGDASSRRYSRVVSGKLSWVLMEAEPFQAANYPLLNVQSHFKKNHILVPEVLGFSEEQGFILYEDLGDITLEQEFLKTRNPFGALGFYRMAIDELLKIHLIASKDKSDCIAFKSSFDLEKLTWELNWTKQYFINGILENNTSNKIFEEEFIKLSEKLVHNAKFIQHRDYHSRNIMVSQNRVRVIDFQDARLGLVQYDLVSLLRDSYVPIPKVLENELLDYYLNRARADFNQSWNVEEFKYLYEVQALQRQLKAVGSFASFWVRRKDTRYLKYIPGTMNRVQEGLEQLLEFKLLKTLLSDCGAFEWSEQKLV